MLQGLAARLGAEHPGFDMTAMELIEATLRASGRPDARTVLERRWLDVQPAYEDAHFLNGFGHADKRFHFAPDWSRIGPDHARMPKLPDQFAAIDTATAAHPFRMVTAPARQFLNTSFTETPGSRRREGRPTVLVHPEDAARLGVTDGGRVRLGNARGSVVLHARLFDGVLPGVIVAESVWPNDAFEGGIGINALTSDDPAPPLGGGGVPRHRRGDGSCRGGGGAAGKPRSEGRRVYLKQCRHCEASGFRHGATVMQDIQALAFDTGGTVLNWHAGIRSALAEAGARRRIEREWAAVANDYRRRTLQRMTNTVHPGFNMDDVMRDGLDEIAAEHRLDAFDAEDRTAIVRRWRALDAWPDFPPAAARLRTRYPVVSFHHPKRRR